MRPVVRSLVLIAVTASWLLGHGRAGVGRE
jgi:hypothetical protein